MHRTAWPATLRMVSGVFRGRGQACTTKRTSHDGYFELLYDLSVNMCALEYKQSRLQSNFFLTIV